MHKTSRGSKNEFQNDTHQMSTEGWCLHVIQNPFLYQPEDGERRLRQLITQSAKCDNLLDRQYYQLYYRPPKKSMGLLACYTFIPLRLWHTVVLWDVSKTNSTSIFRESLAWKVCYGAHEESVKKATPSEPMGRDKGKIRPNERIGCLQTWETIQ